MIRNIGSRVDRTGILDFETSHFSPYSSEVTNSNRGFVSNLPYNDRGYAFC